jgi:hypothetical protein
MATHLTTVQMKQFVRDHFEDFVNKRRISTTTMDPAESQPIWQVTNR